MCRQGLDGLPFLENRDDLWIFLLDAERRVDVHGGIVGNAAVFGVDVREIGLEDVEEFLDAAGLDADGNNEIDHGAKIHRSSLLPQSRYA